MTPAASPIGRRPRIESVPGHRNGCIGVPEPHIERLADGRWRVVVRCQCKLLIEEASSYRDLSRAEVALRRMRA